MGPAGAAERYTYAETSYANPHSLTGYFNGTATTTYTYDTIGNLASTTGAATSTYGYDHNNQRVRQTSTTTTTRYPSKFYSIEYLSLSTMTATSTSYIWQGDPLFAYVAARQA